MPYRRTEATIRHITRAAPEPIIHLALSMHKHFELLSRFGDMHAHAQSLLLSGIRAQSQQLRQSRVRRMRRKVRATSSGPQRIDFSQRFLDDLSRLAPAGDANHFQE